MGKGVVDDDHDYCIAAARSTALKDADLIVLLGARLNWMLHFGKQPRFSDNVKIVQVTYSYETLKKKNSTHQLIDKVDINAEELGNNTNNCIQVQADIKSFCEQVKQKLC